MKALRNRLTWIFLALFLLPVLASAVWYGRQVRQQRLDHALIEAIKRSYTPAAIALLDQGADANAVDLPERSVTLDRLWDDLCNRLKGEVPYYPPALLIPYQQAEKQLRVGQAVRLPLDNTTLVKALLQKGADPHVRDLDDDQQRTLLHYAARYDQAGTVRLLLAHSVPPDVRDHLGTTPLMGTFGTGIAPECARALIEAGADVNARDRFGWTALMNPHQKSF